MIEQEGRRWKLFRYLSVWLVMLMISVANGAVRDFTYGKKLSELRAHQVSTFTGMVLLGVVIWIFVRRWPPRSGREAFGIGVFWLALTVAFEFLFFYFAGGHPWSELLADYNLAGGRVWVLLLVWV